MPRLLPQFSQLALAPDTPIDLHMHTDYSDGRWPARQLLEYLHNEQFAFVSVTDHDRVDKVAEIQELAASYNLPVLAGVEMTTEWRGNMAHMLCYGFDPEHNEIGTVAEQVVQRQLENTHAVYEELQRRGYRFPRQESVLAKHKGRLNRPSDNALLLQEHKYAPDWRTAIQMITDAGFRSIKADMGETVDAAHKSGAVCLIAHPGRRERGFVYYDTELLDQIRSEIPLDGLEVYHPYHDSATIAMYVDYVSKHHLLMSTGSDSHTTPGRMPAKHRAEVSGALLERMGITIAQAVK